jgi:hypothetical protein
MASDAAHLPSLVPKTSKGPNVPREDTARRKSASKSRNGMFVFVSQLRSFEIVGRKNSARSLVSAVAPCMLALVTHQLQCGSTLPGTFGQTLSMT